MTKEKFAELILQKEEMMYKMAMSMLKNEEDCEDAMQSAILRAFEKLGTLKKEEYFGTWLMRILINTCNEQLRRRKRTALWEDTQAAASSPQEKVETCAAIEALPTKYRQVIVLYYSQQFSVKEISAILKIPKGTVLSRLDKGRKLLRMELA